MAAAVAGTTLVASLLTAPASPMRATTLTGPVRVGWEGTVTLTGHTPTPKSPVTIYFHRAGSAGYTARRTLTSNAAGTFSTTYVADADYRYYAVSGTSRSTPGLTSLVRPSCTTSGPVFSIKGLPANYAHPDSADRASLQATNDAGIWAGYVVDLGHYSLISWSAATHRTTVLDSLDVSSGNTPQGDHGPVEVVAVTKHGSVLAAEQTLKYGTAFTHYVGYVYSGGHRYKLKTAPNWTSAEPVGITKAGVIWGQVNYGPQQNAIVTWANATAPYKVVARDAAYLAVDGNGDYSYLSDPDTITVRRASGAVVATLPQLDNQMQVADGGSSFYGTVFGDRSVQRWTVTGSGLKLQKLTPNLRLYAIAATEASSRGAVVVGNGTVQHFRTAEGGYVTLPAEPGPYGLVTGTAISSNNTVAFTSSHDNLVHFFSCT